MRWMPTLLALLCASPALAQDCPDPAVLDAGATVGQLTDLAVSCLDAVCFGDGTVPDRLEASRLLIAHFHAKGAKTDWARVVQYTLRDLDPDNADLTYRYGLHLLQFGAFGEALVYGERALAHAYAWDDLTDRNDRMYNLYSLRAHAGVAMMEAVPVDGPAIARRVVETKARLLAVEWIAQAVAAERDTSEAVAVCIETGWDEVRCRDRASNLSVR